MNHHTLTHKAAGLLDHFCTIISTRTVGTQGNRDATAYFQQQIMPFGFEIERQGFTCIDSQRGISTLYINNENYELFTSPLTLACDCEAELVTAEDIKELEGAQCKGKILLLHGEIAKEQLMPKGFEFYNPEEHKALVRLLEQKQPAAILTATAKNPDLAGAVYPFPMIVDGDFDIPSAYLKDIEGEKLVLHSGQIASLKIEAERVPATGENVIARKGDQQQKIVVCAHIDTKEDTPGALDNASGVVILLLLAELLSEYNGKLGIELVAINGEEYYNTPGQITYLNNYRDDFSAIQLAINLDMIGYINGRSAFSFYGVDDHIMEIIRAVYADYDGFFEGPSWYQSDHGIFMAKGIPAMAVTDENLVQLMTEITHTEKDVPGIVDFRKIVENALFLEKVSKELEQYYSKTKRILQIFP